MQNNLSVRVEKLLTQLQHGNPAYETVPEPAPSNVVANNNRTQKQKVPTSPPATTTSTLPINKTKQVLDIPAVRKHIKIANAARDALFSVISGINMYIV